MTCLAVLPALARAQAIAVTNVRILPVSGPPIERGTLVIDGERLAAVGAGVTPPAGATVIDGTGLTAAPGFFDAYNSLGVIEVAQVPATNDSEETSDPIAPQLRVIDAYFLDSALLPVVRAAGTLVTLSAPGPGNPIAGQSALMRTAGTTVAEAAVRPIAAVHLNFGDAPKRAYGGRGRAPMTRMGVQALIRQAWQQAAEYRARRAADAKTPRDTRLEPLAAALDRAIKVVARAHRRGDIEAALDLAEEFKLDLILLGGADAPLLTARLVKQKVPVIYGPIDLQPAEGETANMDYATPALLQRAGVTIAFQSNDPTLARHLVPNIGLAVAYGLPPEEALRALTINPARMFGVAETLGTLDAGKEATFFLSRGDPLQATSRVRMVFVRGRSYEPRSYQTALCEQYIAPRGKDIACLPK